MSTTTPALSTTAPFSVLDRPDLAEQLDVRPLTATIGAEIHGVDLSRPLAPGQVDGIRAVLRQWRVAFFRGQRLDHAAQISLGRQFGELTYAHPHDDTPPEGHPEIYTVDPKRFTARLDADQAKELRRRYSYTSGWHTDVTPAINPPAASILRAEHVPPYGGDTTFTNLVAAYEGLSAPLQRLAEELRAEHYYGANLAPQGAPSKAGYLGRIDQNRLISHHPVVRVIPETGERALFVNPVFTGRIVDVHPDESRRLLELFFAQITRSAHTVRFKWDEGGVAFWDNRTTAHLGPQDLDEFDVERVLHRVTLIGEVPVGVDGRPSDLIEGVPFHTAPVFEPAREAAA
jgi:alpha-ketoglutarate-dependent taurine dioxygenase